MKKTSMILATLIAISLHAQNSTMTSELTKYTSLKNDLYVEKIKSERKIAAQNRETRDLIRDYKALKIYASLRK